MNAITYALGMLSGELEQANLDLEGAIQQENESGDALDSITRANLEGYIDALELAIKTLQEGKTLEGAK